MIYINVTNSFKTRAKTGIQRVVRELGWRLHGNYGCQLIVLHDGYFHGLQAGEELLGFLDAKEVKPSTRLEWTDFKAGDIFFDIDASWGDDCRIDQLWRYLKKRQCILVKMHHDAVPILYPEYSSANTVYRFSENFSAALQYMDYWICISQVVEQDLHRIVESVGAVGVASTVCSLGSDIRIVEQARPPAAFVDAVPKRFMLSVGTVEPRKNYELVLDVFDALTADPAYSDVHCVIVGKSGWNNQGLIDRMNGHAANGQTLHWLSGIPDAELEWLYQHADVCLCLSHYEGFGLPVIEALSRGLPVICTKDSAMDEVANGAAIAVSLDADSVVACVKDFFNSENTGVVDGYRAVSWDESAASIHQFLDGSADDSLFKTLVHQAVFISVRPASLYQSLRSVEQYMAFIDEAIVLTSDAQLEAMQLALQDLTIKVVLISESQLGLNDLPADHQMRNSLLRRHLYAQEMIDDNFIACDDDFQAIAAVDHSVFIREGRHQAHYFYDSGKQWLGALKPTSFDIGVWRTAEILDEGGFDTRLYNAHQPQIINKKMALDILRRTQHLGADEWSSYFNMAKHLKPDAFDDVLYRSGGWPGQGATWLPSQCPSDLLFFNDLPESGDPAAEAQAWRAQVLESMARRAAIAPGLPHCIAASQTLRFTESEMTFYTGEDLCIPFFSDRTLDALTYAFCGRSIELRAPLPNFLHVPIASDMAGAHMDVRVAAVIAGREKTASLRVHVVDGSTMAKH